jgi:hypothetical protein
MDASDDRARADFTGLVRQLMFDAAWLAHQGCCYWSAVMMQESEMRGREKKDGGAKCAELNIFGRAALLP